MIKARIFRVFKDNRHKVDYTFVSPAKYHDDVESVSNDEFITPMMEIRLLKEDNTFEKNSISVWASPDVVRAYTGFEIFNQDYNYSFEGRILDIEFEWIEGVYPYSKLYDSSESLAINVEHSPIEWYERYDSKTRLPYHRDYILSDKIRYPKISKIMEASLNWL